jgi:hypothetical protein
MNNFLEYLLTLELNQIEQRQKFFLNSLIRETNYKQRFDTLELYDLCTLAKSKKVNRSKDSYNPIENKSYR